MILRLLVGVLVTMAIGAGDESASASCYTGGRAAEVSVEGELSAEVAPPDSEPSIVNLLDELRRIDLESPAADSGADDELMRLTVTIQRLLADGSLSERHLRLVLQTCVEGDAAAQPPSHNWFVKYHDILDSYYLHYEYCENREVVLRDLPLRVRVVSPRLLTHERALPWPANTPTYIEIDVETFQREELERYSLQQVTMYAGDEKLAVVQRGMHGPLYVPLPPLDPGEHELLIEVEVGAASRNSGLSVSKRSMVTTRFSVVDDDNGQGISGLILSRDGDTDRLLSSRCSVLLQPLYHDVLDARLYRVSVKYDGVRERLFSPVVGMLELTVAGEIVARAPIGMPPDKQSRWWLGDAEVLSLRDGEFFNSIQATLRSDLYVANRAGITMLEWGPSVWKGATRLPVKLGEPIPFLWD